jgi:hypothetical protein
MRRQNFLIILRESISKARPYIATAFIIVFSLTPLFQNTAYRVGVAASFGVVLLYLFFDIYREVIQRLEAIEKNLKEPNPPNYEDFGEASIEIDKILKEQLNANRNIHIRVLGVSAQFSWKHIVEDKLSRFLEMGNKKQTITIEFVIVEPKTLEKINQVKLTADTERTIKGIKIMNDRYKSQINSERLSINVYKYDNIPHWHGVLINTDTFFMGRCRWNISGNIYELEVGTNEYRLFKVNDRFKGTDRVNLCINWFEAYKLQGKKIE